MFPHGATDPGYIDDIIFIPLTASASLCVQGYVLSRRGGPRVEQRVSDRGPRPPPGSDGGLLPIRLKCETRVFYLKKSAETSLPRAMRPRHGPLRTTRREMRINK